MANATGTSAMEAAMAAEPSLWIGSYAVVSVVGLFARYLDAVEEKKAGVLKLVNSNMFCAIFTGSITVQYISVLLLQACHGSFDRFYDVLKGVETLSPLQEFQARINHSLMLGYMTQDLFGRLLWGNYKIAYILHHVACQVGIVACLYFGQTAMFGCAVGLSEASTPLVAIVEISRAQAMKDMVIFSGLLLNLVFPLRVALFSWITYVWTFEHVDSPLNSEEKWELTVPCLVSIWLLTLLNWHWWRELATTTFKVLWAVPAAKPKTT
mmetsp:Transcript_2088/g.3979  ORF Transcript_2088/g.3979 Transcript_2088/m.3979 type:complete len:267 (+) Transcript_2088:298-1098(+)